MPVITEEFLRKIEKQGKLNTLKISEKDIARRFNVSHVTVNRVINSHFTDYIPNKEFLPKVLCFDEFKSTKDCAGAMSFIMWTVLLTISLILLKIDNLIV